MSSVQWFPFRSALHARNPEKERFSSLCGLVPLDDDLRVQLADASDVPAGACPRCLIAVALSSTIDEDVDESKARGYLPTDRVNL